MLLWVIAGPGPGPGPLLRPAGPGPGPGPLAMGGNFFKQINVLNKNKGHVPFEQVNVIGRFVMRLFVTRLSHASFHASLFFK